jgi:hypothetical protein
MLAAGIYLLARVTTFYQPEGYERVKPLRVVYESFAYNDACVLLKVFEFSSGYIYV